MSRDGPDIEALAADIVRADTVVVLTGAGVSTASGIPDFRSEGGVWEQFDPADFHYERFRADPSAFWERRVALHEAIYGESEGSSSVGPNAAHEALATLESRGHLAATVTQNVDGLHAAAGTEAVVELHGNASRVVCEDCGCRTSAAPVRERVERGDLPPRCVDCGGLLKPDVVLFGEALPTPALQRARDLARAADVFLAIGSSLTVEPAASLPTIARRADATLAVCNLESTPVSDVAEYDIRADVTESLPRLVDTIGGSSG